MVGAARLNELQRLAVQHTRLGIPLIFGLDVIHGYTTDFPIPLGQASSFDPGVASTDAVVSAAEARRSGITWTYAPMMDVTHEPRWGRIAEGAGEDPYLATQIAVAKVRGYQGKDYSAQDKLAACAKHYVAYGGAEGGRDYNTVDVSIQDCANHYLPPFKASVAAGVATVMASFNAISGVPAHANAYVLREILKGACGFDGFVVSDYTGIQELIHARGGRGRCRRGRGRDHRRGGHGNGDPPNYVDFGSQLLAQGRITRRDDRRRGPPDPPGEVRARPVRATRISTTSTEVIAVSDCGTGRAARAAAGRSMVLMKNDNGLLPLSRGRASVAVIGPLATATYDLNGTWSGLGTGAAPTAGHGARRDPGGGSDPRRSASRRAARSRPTTPADSRRQPTPPQRRMWSCWSSARAQR